MKQFLQKLAYYTIALLISSLVGYLLGMVVRSTKMPPPDPNIPAYQYLSYACNSQDIRTIKAYADAALQNTTDPDIRFMADLMSRKANQLLQSGISQQSEGQTFTAVLKQTYAQLNDPFLYFQGLGIAWDELTNDTKKVIETLNARYQPYFGQIQQANTAGGGTFIISSIALFVCLHLGRKSILNKLFPQPAQQTPPYSHYKAPQPEPEKPKVEEPTITCPNCQARNRNRILSSGQKLVCGQCKTVLLSVS